MVKFYDRYGKKTIPGRGVFVPVADYSALLAELVEVKRERDDLKLTADVERQKVEFRDKRFATLEARAEAAEAKVKRLEEALTALKNLVALSEGYSPFVGEIYQDRIDRAWDAARAAIAKAEECAALAGGSDD